MLGTLSLVQFENKGLEAWSIGCHSLEDDVLQMIDRELKIKVNMSTMSRRMGYPLVIVFMALMIMSSTLPSCYAVDEITCYEVGFCQGNACKFTCTYRGFPHSTYYCRTKPDGSPQCCCEH